MVELRRAAFNDTHAWPVRRRSAARVATGIGPYAFRAGAGSALDGHVAGGRGVRRAAGLQLA